MAQFRTRQGASRRHPPDRQAGGLHVARRRRPRAPRPAAGRQEGGSRRHARPVRHRPAGGAGRPGHQAGALLRRPAQGVRVHGAVRLRSDTGDLTGELAETGRATTPTSRRRCCRSFLGRITQRVPMTSAVKVDGERLYKKAHRGEVIETPVKRGRDRRPSRCSSSTRRRRPCAAASRAPRAPTCASSPSTSARPSAPARTSSSLARAATGDLRLEDAQTLAGLRGGRRGARGRRRAHPRPVSPGRGAAVHARHRAVGGAGDGGAQRRPPARAAPRSRCASPSAASSSRSTGPPRRARAQAARQALMEVVDDLAAGRAPAGARPRHVRRRARRAPRGHRRAPSTRPASAA